LVSGFIFALLERWQQIHRRIDLRKCGLRHTLGMRAAAAMFTLTGNQASDVDPFRPKAMAG